MLPICIWNFNLLWNHWNIEMLFSSLVYVCDLWVVTGSLWQLVCIVAYFQTLTVWHVADFILFDLLCSRPVYMAFWDAFIVMSSCCLWLYRFGICIFKLAVMTYELWTYDRLMEWWIDGCTAISFTSSFFAIVRDENAVYALLQLMLIWKADWL